MPDGGHRAAPVLPDGFTADDIQLLLDNIDKFSDDEIEEIQKLVEELERRKYVQSCHDDLIAFCRHMQADYKVGAHHRRLAGLLEDIERGTKDRICVSVPPRHGKSVLTSVMYTAWYLGRNPTHKIMLVSHTTDLAVDFGRKVRNLIAADEYREIFPNVELSKDSKSAGRWHTTSGAEFYATGVGSALAGRGAHLLVVDDPHSEQDVLAGNFAVFEKAYDWFAYGARTRLMPGGKVAVVHCMTGETGVLRPDGTETFLKDIRPGDVIASYDGGRLVSKKVLNWANQGPDAIFTVALKDGKKVRANARHPFLVLRDGVETWVKVRNLQTGDLLVSTGAGVPDKQNQNLVDATGALRRLRVSEKARQLVNTIGTRVRYAANRAAQSLRYVKGCVAHTTMFSTGGSTRALCAQTSCETITYSATTGSASKTTTERSQSKTTAAEYAKSIKVLPLDLSGLGNAPRSLSTIATKAERSASFFARGATLLFKKGSPRASYSAQFSTSEIISIAPDGVEDVFDIQVEDTENFIANGVVSHNTRWHESDLIGRLIQDMTNNSEADQYEVFEFPAIMELKSTDPDTGEVVVAEKALWPEFFDLAALKRTKASMPTFQWLSQYQQKPTAEEASIVKREWWRVWQKDDPPPCEYIIMSLDAAAEAHNRADFTSLTTWGVFFNEEENAHNIILLNAIKERLEFPDLKDLAVEQYRDWDPDAFIVEKKSSGTPLYQEMRRMGIPVGEYTPVRGTQNNPNTKMARLNSVADIIRSGLVWVPDRRWAEELVEEVAGFPFMAHDDQVDSTIMALMRFRQGGFVRLPSDEIEDELPYRPRVEYY